MLKSKTPNFLISISSRSQFFELSITYLLEWQAFVSLGIVTDDFKLFSLNKLTA
jgi:hypothetical protein